MQIYPILEEYLALSEQHQRIALSIEIDSTALNSLEVFSILNRQHADAVIFESSSTDDHRCDYSYIAIQSKAQLLAKKNIIHKTINGLTSLHHEQPLTILRELSRDLSCYIHPEHAAKITSSIGFLSYDAVRYFEAIPDRHAHDDIPEILFNFYRTSLSFNHEHKRLTISIVDDSNDKSTYRYKQLNEEIQALITLISHPEKNITTEKDTAAYQANLHTDIDDEEFIEIVEKAKKSIYKGDAFQIVLSRRFFQNYTTSPLKIYETLKTISPAPYTFYLPYKDYVIVGASPERLLAVENGVVSINPIAGTRRREKNSNLNDIAEDLLSDTKEVAEHMMLVDLARNDIGAVCQPGSIAVKELLKIKHFSHLTHITSLVTGQLQAKYDAYDALHYAFPAGTLSGAPKIRAMEIIDELETSRRGLYGGAIFRLDYLGNLNSCIAIRMAVLKEGIATVRTGAGIVYDSEPLKEAEETRTKARNVLEAIKIAHQSSQEKVAL